MPQDANFHGPGAFSGLVTWDAGRRPLTSLRALLSRMRHRLQENGRVRLLIGIASGLSLGLPSGVLPRDAPELPSFPRPQVDLVMLGHGFSGTGSVLRAAWPSPGGLHAMPPVGQLTAPDVPSRPRRLTPRRSQHV